MKYLLNKMDKCGTCGGELAFGYCPKCKGVLSVTQPRHTGEYEIIVAVPMESRAVFKGLIPMAKFICGEKFEYDFLIRNAGKNPFPEEDMCFLSKIEWTTQQEIHTKRSIKKNSIKPGEEERIHYDGDCMGEGFALVTIEFAFKGRAVHPFLVWWGAEHDEKPQEQRMLVFKEITVNNEKRWSYVRSKGAFVSFYVTRWQEIYSFVALIVASLSALISSIGLILSVVLR